MADKDNNDDAQRPRSHDAEILLSSNSHDVFVRLASGTISYEEVAQTI